MRPIPLIAAYFAIALAAGPFLQAAHADEAAPQERPERCPQASPRQRPRLFAELSAGPLLGLDEPLRGASADALAGIRFSPFEAGLRTVAARDSRLDTWDTRFDFVLGLGGGLRAIMGGLLIGGRPMLADSSGQEAAVYATPADWPNRFGIGATIAELFPRSRGPALGLDAELVYTSYRVEAQNALSGAAAFAAGVEARVALRLRWGARRLRP